MDKVSIRHKQTYIPTGRNKEINRPINKEVNKQISDEKRRRERTVHRKKRGSKREFSDERGRP